MDTLTVEKEMLEKLIRGDSKAYEQFYKDNRNMVVKIVMNNSGQEEDIGDLMQEALFIFIKKIRKSDFQLTAKLSTYFYGIAHKLWLRKLTKKGISTTEFEESHNNIMEDDELERKMIYEKKFELLEKILNTLDPKCQKIIMEYYYKNRRLNEIGEEMGYAYGSARVRKKKCMDSFRKKMNEDKGFQDLNNEENE